MSAIHPNLVRFRGCDTLLFINDKLNNIKLNLAVSSPCFGIKIMNCELIKNA